MTTDQQNPERMAFLARHNISVEGYEKTGLKWHTLANINSKYLQTIAQLQTTADYILGRIREVPAVHSLKLRIKDPEHLLAKIIRKKIERSELDIDPNNYNEKITDLIGIRVLHLFKDQWQIIHEFVNTTWDLDEEPIAYVREGDPESVLQTFREQNCRVETHQFGYRSVHYVIKSQPAKQSHLAEVQVRTIFEEGWSEIDHQIRYPQHTSNPFLSDFLRIFNRLAGSADEMGSYIKALSQHVREQDKKLLALQEKAEKSVSELQISENEKKRIQAQIDELRKSAQTRNESLVNALGSAPSSLFQYTTAPSAGTSILSSLFGTAEKSCLTCGKSFRAEYPESFHMLCPECRQGQYNPFGK